MLCDIFVKEKEKRVYLHKQTNVCVSGKDFVSKNIQVLSENYFSRVYFYSGFTKKKMCLNA